MHACVEATASHTALPIQFYLTPGGPTVDMDDVDVHESLAVNGGFEYGSGPWGTYPNTNSTYDAFPTSQVYGPLPPVVSSPVAVQLPRPTAPHALKVRIFISWTWRYGLTWLDKVRIGRFPGRTRLTVRCLGRGCPLHSKKTATGKRHVRRLLRTLQGRRFRAGDVLWITLTAPGYRPERVKVVIRYGKLPFTTLLSR